MHYIYRVFFSLLLLYQLHLSSSGVIRSWSWGPGFRNTGKQKLLVLSLGARDYLA